MKQDAFLQRVLYGWFMALLFFFAGLPEAWATITLFADGQAKAVLVLASGATLSETRARAEMVTFLRQMTGVTFAIASVPSPTKANILIGPGAALLADASFSTAALGKEGIVIRTTGNNIILAGAGTRGTLYAVYSFLEDQLGCRWWTSTESTIPTRTSIVIGDLDITYVPPLWYRETDHARAVEGYFSVRNKYNATFHNLSDAQGGKVSFTALSGWYVHSFWTLLPPETYYSLHPEWYILYKGVPQTLDLTNETMRVELVKNLKTHLALHPEASIVSVSQIDDDGFPGQLNGGTTPDGRNESDLTVAFVNKVAEDIEADYPNILVETLAYHYTQAPPNMEVPRHNVLIRLCNIGCSFSVPMTHERNAAFYNDFQGWSAITNKLFIWNYAGNFTYPLLPHPDLRSIAANTLYWANHGVIGVFQESPGAYAGDCELDDLRTWVMAKLLWNPSLDFNTVLADFCNGYYGAAGPYIITYINLIHDEVESTGDYLGLSSPPTAAFLNARMLSKAWKYLQQAEAAVAGNATLLARVQKVKDTIVYACDALNISTTTFLTAAASSEHAERAAVHTIDGSGLTEDGLRHISYGYIEGTGINAWASSTLAASAANPHPGTVSGSHWIKYEFGSPSIIKDMTIWNYHEYVPYQYDWRIFGLKNVTIQYSLTGGSDPADWTTIFTGQIPMSPMVIEAPISLVVDFGNALARYVVITATAGVDKNWSNGQIEQVGLSEVAFTVQSPQTCSDVIDIGYAYAGDLNSDCRVNLTDFALFAQSWQRCLDPADANCERPWEN